MIGGQVEGRGPWVQLLSYMEHLTILHEMVQGFLQEQNHSDMKMPVYSWPGSL